VPDIDIGGTTLHYATSGAGEPILLIPGLGLDHSYYRFGMPLLARHLQVLAVDPCGIGRSTKTPPPYTVEAWADDFAKTRARRLKVVKLDPRRLKGGGPR
jgi:aminoacrylate hydrolase